MASKRRPKYDQVLDGVRVRVYATRSEYEVLLGEGDVADPNAQVWCYPKIGTPAAWAAQGRLSYEDPDG